MLKKQMITFVSLMVILLSFTITSCSKDENGYQIKSGTSMATPVVTGALALAFQKYPYFSPAEMKLRLYERAYPRGTQLGKKSWGIIHVDNLVRG